MPRLHWTVDHAHEYRNWDYTAEFTTALAKALSPEPFAPTPDRKTHRYLMLPNFWEDLYPRDRIEMGSVTIDRSRKAGDWSYRVTQTNDQSGENLTLEFTCGDERLRPIRSPWTIRTTNTADGAYDGVAWTGRCQSAPGGLDVRLTTSSGMSFVSGSCRPQNPTGFWALLDILPNLAGNPAPDLCILEDLQVPKPHCRVRPLERWTFEAGGERHDLAGYSLHGEGLPPSYWWITRAGDVAAIGMNFSTYVLAERNG